MAFDPPTLTEFKTALRRTLRDETGSIFSPEVVDDFVDQAMADLSAYRPKEVTEKATWPWPTNPKPFDDFMSVWKVEVHVQGSPSGYVRTLSIPHGDPNSPENRAGWDFYAGVLTIPPFWVTRLNASTQNQPSEMWVYGYAEHDLPTAPGTVIDLTDQTDYNCVFAHCKSLGFEMLTHDRSLYQQWLAATNNTDVSPTQLMGMANLAESTFQRLRARNTKLRRVPMGDYLTVN